MATLIKNIYIAAEEYGPDKGKLRGKIKFASQFGEVEIQIEQQHASKIVELMADAIVRSVQDVAGLMTQQVIDQARNGVPAIE